MISGSKDDPDSLQDKHCKCTEKYLPAFVRPGKNCPGPGDAYDSGHARHAWQALLHTLSHCNYGRSRLQGYPYPRHLLARWALRPVQKGATCGFTGEKSVVLQCYS